VVVFTIHVPEQLVYRKCLIFYVRPHSKWRLCERSPDFLLARVFKCQSHVMLPYAINEHVPGVMGSLHES